MVSAYGLLGRNENKFLSKWICEDVSWIILTQICHTNVSSIGRITRSVTVSSPKRNSVNKEINVRVL
jgi:hypothetical protein